MMSWTRGVTSRRRFLTGAAAVGAGALAGSVMAPRAASAAGQLWGPPAVGRTGSGLLGLFSASRDGTIRHAWQLQPGGSFSGWLNLGGWAFNPFTTIAVATNLDGRLEFYATRDEPNTGFIDYHLFHRWQTNTGDGWIPQWQDWGLVYGPPSVARNADGRIEVFSTDFNGTVIHRAQTAPNSGWGSWATLPVGGDAVKVAKNLNGRLEIFVTRYDILARSVKHMWQTAAGGPWSDWFFLPDTPWRFSDVLTSRNHDGRLEIFGWDDGSHTPADDLHNRLYHIWQTAPAGAWATRWVRFLDGVDLDDYVVANHADGRLILFANDPAIVDTVYTEQLSGGGWRPWTPLPAGPLYPTGRGPMAVAANSDGRLSLFKTVANGTMLHNWQWTPSGNWSGWASLGGG